MDDETNNQLLHQIAGVDESIDLTNNQLLKIIAGQITGGGENAGTLNGEPGTYYLNRTNHTGTQAISTVTGLQADLDGKLDPADVVADGPVDVTNQQGVVHVGLTAGNDGEAIVTLNGTPTWGNQTANAVGAVATNSVGQANGVASLNASGVVPSGQLDISYSDLSNAPINRVSGTVQLQLDGEELIWPTDVETGKIRLYNSTPGSNNTFYGLGVQNGVQVYQVDSNTSKHVFQGVDGSDNALTILEMSSDGGVVSHVDLHMSEQKVVNIADGTNARDAVNKQQLDAVSSTGATASRPGSPATGNMYFDTDLGHPIWYNGTAWVDATGTAV